MNSVLIPDALKARSQWLVWKLENRGSKPSKVPYCAKTWRLGKSNDPASWCDFDTALKAALNGQGYDGIGFAFAEGDELAGVDVDYPWDSPIAVKIREQFQGTYCEKSPSGKLRIFCYGRPRRRGKGTEDKAIEVYNYESPRYLSVTGDWLKDTAVEVTGQQAALDWLHERYFKPKEKPEAQPKPQVHVSLSVSDQEVIDRAKDARNGGKFSTLFYGDWQTAGYPSHSEADLALCLILAFWTQDAAQIDRVFRQSTLMRPKWDKRHHADGETYGEMTIRRALASISETYRPRQHEGPLPDGEQWQGEATVELPENDHWPRLKESDKAEMLDSDRANGVRLATVFGQELLHAERIGWHAWVGTHWRRSDEEAVRIASQLSRVILKEAVTVAEKASQEASAEMREILGKPSRKAGHMRAQIRKSMARRCGAMVRAGAAQHPH